MIDVMRQRDAHAASMKKLMDRRRDAQTLLLELIGVGLYQPLELSDQSSSELRGLRTYSKNFDLFCPSCKKEATWEVLPTADSIEYDRREAVGSLMSGVAEATRTDQLENYWLGNFDIQATCTRGGHKFSLFLHAIQQPHFISIQKIGQFPSSRDIELGNLKDFELGLTEKMRKEYVRAITCAGHGLSVAACVHYRRIFEDILDEAKTLHMAANSMESWPEFDKSHVSEKIALVRDELPTFVTDHPNLYALLSIGIHQLSEQECADEITTLRGAMDVIFKDRTAKARERAQKDETAKLVQQALARHRK